MTKRDVIWEEITIQFGGRPISGSYSLENGILEVRTIHDVKAKQLGESPVEETARRLLRELAAEGKNKKAALNSRRTKAGGIPRAIIERVWFPVFEGFDLCLMVGLETW